MSCDLRDRVVLATPPVARHNMNDLVAMPFAMRATCFGCPSGLTLLFCQTSPNRSVGARDSYGCSRPRRGASAARPHPQSNRAIRREAKAADGGSSSNLTALLAKATDYLRQVLGPFTQTEMLTINDVAVLLNCSYGEARNKLLDGRVVRSRMAAGFGRGDPGSSGTSGNTAFAQKPSRWR